MNNRQTEHSQKPVEPAQPTGIARRRLLRAGLAAVPVALTVSGRSAMANGTCSEGLSPMSWNSLAPDGTNCQLASHTVALNTLGVSPGNWKPNGNGVLSQAWPNSCIPYAGYPSDPLPSSHDSPLWDAGTTFQAIFGGSETRSVSRILLESNGQLIWHLCAAYLNAATIAGYAMTIQDVKDAYAGKIGSKTGLTDAQIIIFLSQTWV